MLTNQVHGAWFGLRADRVKRFWRRHLSCEGESFLTPLLPVHSMLLTFKRRRNHLLSLLSIPMFRTRFSSGCKFGRLRAEGYERVGCVSRSAAVSRQGERHVPVCCGKIHSCCSWASRICKSPLHFFAEPLPIYTELCRAPSDKVPAGIPCKNWQHQNLKETS